MIGVGNTFDKSDFQPSNFKQCVNVADQLGKGETKYLECKSEVRGRYVTVYLKEKEYLTICELQVYGGE